MIEAFQTLLIMIDTYLKIFNFKENLICRENEQLSCYTNTTPQRAKFVEVLKVLVKRNCVLQEKLVFPSVNRSALFSLISLICPSFEKGERSIKVNQFNFHLFIKVNRFNFHLFSYIYIFCYDYIVILKTYFVHIFSVNILT